MQVERSGDKLTYNVTVNTDVEFDSATLDEIMKTNDFIVAIERGDDDWFFSKILTYYLFEVLNKI